MLPVRSSARLCTTSPAVSFEPGRTMTEVSPSTALATFSRHPELVAAWLEALRFESEHGRIAPATYRTYGSAVRPWVTWVHGLGTDPTGLDAYHFLAHRALTAHPATVNTALSALRSCYAWMETQGHYRDIARGLKPLRVYRDGPLPAFTRAQVVDLVRPLPGAAPARSPISAALRACALARDAAIIRILFATGMRLVSMIRMDVGDVSEAGSERLTIMHQPKGHRTKDTPALVPPRAARAWHEYLRYRAALGVPGGAAWIGLWPKLGTRLDASSFRRIVTRRADLAGLRQRSAEGGIIAPRAHGPHALRRAAAVEAIDRFGLETGQVLLGHASADQTRRSYARVHRYRLLAEACDHLDLEV